MLTFYRHYSRYIYYYGVILLAASLPLSIYTTSLFEIVLLVNWILEGNFRKKFSILKERKSLLLIIGLYALHLVGLLYSDPANYDYAFKDLKVKLPILILPLIIGTSEALNRKQLKTILLIFCLATFSSTIVSFGVFLGIVPYEYYDFRDISIFVSHIRLALMVNLSIFILIYYMFRSRDELGFSPPVSVAATIIIFWFLFFFVLLKSLTGFIIFGVLILVLGWIYAGRIISGFPRILVRTVIIAIPLLIFFYLYNSIERFYETEDIEFSELEEFTSLDNPYSHDTLKRARENGYYVWIYVAEDEMEEAWNERSDIPYDSLDNKGQEIKYTLIRYLTSKGLRKDREGVRALSEEDIEAIENGKANYIFKNKYSLYPRIYEVIWEIDGYLRGGDPSGHSVAQRIAYLNAAKYIFMHNPVIGVGTGDVKYSFDQYYHKTNSKLEKDYRRRAHNQYVTFLITFGILGFIFAMIFLIAPVFIEKAWNDYLFIVFFFIAFLSMLNEDTMETQTGVSFFIFFYSLLLFGRKKTQKMNQKYLKRAIKMAEGNIDQGGGPFGALIIKDGEVIAEAANRVTPDNDPTAHAEILAIRAAARKLKTWDLSGCELYTSCEPCPMCLGAVYWAHIDKVYFAASHEDARHAGFDDADMYTEVKKEPSERKILMKSELEEEGKKVFHKWRETEDKREY